MANPHRTALLNLLKERFGEVSRLTGSQSLFVIGDDAARVYYRYSKVHERGRTFFGLREVDLRQLQGHNSFLCLMLDDGSPPLFIPFADFEEIFQRSEPASDGQYKVQLFASEQSRELYIARQGRFNVDGYVGVQFLEQNLKADQLRQEQSLTHSQVQTLLAGVGHTKGYAVRVPPNDATNLDWNLTDRFKLTMEIPGGFADVAEVLGEIDVIWTVRGSNEVGGLFEVEHSTPVYSGLLRFNDMLLVSPKLSRFFIVSNESRRSVFSRQVFRPTFKKSGLSDLVSFLDYRNVYQWHRRLVKGEDSDVAKTR